MSGAWITLFVAGFLEVCWAIGLKYSHGFTKPFPTFLTILALIGSIYLLACSTRILPIGTAYAVWVGIGALGTALAGIFLLNEPVSVSTLFFLSLLLVAIIGLKLTSVY